MADIKISALPDGGEAVSTDDILVVRAGANRRVRPPLPFGPYADAAALQTAKAAATYPGRHAYVGSAAPYTIYTSNGATWAVGAIGPYATAAALETAFPAATNTGRFASVGSAAPYKLYSSNGAAWVPAVDVAGVLPTAPIQVTASRNIASTDNGLVLECTATATLTVPASLPAGFRCVVIPFGTTSVAFTGTTGNGAATTITRAASSNAAFGIMQRGSNANSYIVDGV